MRSAVVAVLLAGCFRPVPLDGAPCMTDDNCPSSQRCVAGECRSGPGGDDANTTQHDAALDAPIDAPIDAPPDAAAPCTTAGFGCATTSKAFVCGTTCFVWCDANLGHGQAANRCAAWGGVMPVLDTADLNACVAQNITINTWMGLTQPANQASPSAGWQWTGGVTPVFTNWANGQPNDLDGVENGAEQCAYFQTINDNWHDHDCPAAFRYMCSR